MLCDLKDKVVIITGGGGLLGKALAQAILEKGGICVLADIDGQSLAIAKSKLVRVCGDAAMIEIVRTDICSKSSFQRLLKRTLKIYSRIDALVNCAYPKNAAFGRKLEAVTYGDFCDNVSKHLGGYFLASQQCALFFKKQEYGNIIMLSSIYGVAAPRFDIYENAVFRGKPMTMPVEYAAIKAAVIHLTRYMARYFKSWNVRVNCVSPGGIRNNQPKIFCDRYKRYATAKGLLDAEDVTGAVLFLLSDRSRYINGQNIVIDDGWTL